MKLFHVILLLVGPALALFGGINWGRAGFPINLGEISTTLVGTKPWHLDKESYLFLSVLGVIVATYSLFELRIKRWER